MQKWEIKVIEVFDKDLTTEIAQAGQDGWELVSVVVVPYTKGTGIAYFFKRPVLAPKGFYTMHIDPATGKADSVSFNEYPTAEAMYPTEKPEADLTEVAPEWLNSVIQPKHPPKGEPDADAE